MVDRIAEFVSVLSPVLCLYVGGFVLLIVLMLFGTRRRTKRTFTPRELDRTKLPTSFRERCPMCGGQRLQWGSFLMYGGFVPEGQRVVTTLVKDTSRMWLAAQCEQCGHTMLFDQK